MYWLLVYVSGIPWKSTCWSAGTTNSVRIKREPALSFRRRRDPLEQTANDAHAKSHRHRRKVPLPDAVSQAAIKFLVGRTRRRLSRAGIDADRRFARDMAAYPIAEHVAQANAQHYEISAEFFGLVLGPQRKYSCCLYEDGVETLAGAEERALRVSADHAAACGRAAHSGTGLWLGFALAVDGRPFPECANNVGIQLALPASVYRR